MTVINTQNTKEQVEEMVWEQRRQYHLAKRQPVTGGWQRERNDMAASEHRTAANYYTGCLSRFDLYK